MDFKRLLAGKVLFYDIENSPMTISSFNIGSKVSISHNQILSHSKIICIAFKDPAWKEAKVLKWDMKKKCDRKLLVEFCKIARRYKILIGHNADNFDYKTIKARLYAEKLPPLTSCKSYDTLKLSRQNFRLPSQRLDFHSKLNGHSGKDPMEFQDWLDITYEPSNSKKYITAMNKMCKYCKLDVLIDEGVFFDGLPYYEKLPHHLGLMISGNRNSCAKCGSLDLIKNGSAIVGNSIKQKWKCKGCGYIWNDNRSKHRTDKLYRDKFI